ncbi:MAG TPA: hypothetical protein VJK51_04200 [Candidatus Nanoarchaeia archaeon]|nr:hypothetical protein [Candidatus Nanoarchaeia archaeon]
MNKKRDSLKSIGSAVLIAIAFISGGTGLALVYNSQKDIASIIGGFTLVGIGVAIVYKLIQNN